MLEYYLSVRQVETGNDGSVNGNRRLRSYNQDRSTYTDLYLEAPRLYEYNGTHDTIEYRNGKYYHIQRVDTTVPEVLTEPIETEVNAKGQLLGFENGSVEIAPVLSSIQAYNSGITTDLDIQSLDTLIKLNSDGTETELDTSTAVITDNSFTHPELSDGDMVWFAYYYVDTSNVFGETTITYYDSRVVKLSPDGTAWRLIAEVDDTGAVTWTTEEVS